MMEISKYLDDVKETAEQLKKNGETIEKIISVLEKTREAGNQVFIIGNGGSASTATHMAADLFKMGGLRAFSFDNIPLNSALINDEGWNDVYSYQVLQLMKKNDVLIAFSVHGGVGEDKAGEWSQNICKAVDYAKSVDGYTIGITGFTGGILKELCDICLVIPAESTALVESFHLIIEHLIAFSLYGGERI